MMTAQELTVRQAAKRAGRSEETIRRWIWSGRLPAVKRGTSYRIDVVRLEEVIVELDAETSGHADPRKRWRQWLDDVARWKTGLKATTGVTAADLLIEDRRARR
ncbi:MAG: helix-turn-helix domain-containing protein [Nocardiopsaceae bacterium]|jgi:excisionase family DNA binding protein|nr:helix-turn-helix domain-containing protein [Nocardiopsaceae bacterium]